MNSNQQKALAHLKELQATLERFDHKCVGRSEFDEWKLAVHVALTRLLGEGARFVGQFDAIDWHGGAFAGLWEGDPRRKAFLRAASSARTILSVVVREAEDYDNPEQPTVAASHQHRPNPSVTPQGKAFIVHGHDNAMKESVARFLERLGITPVILHEQASGGRTIIEKIEAHSDVAIAIVLLSPDDIGGSLDRRHALKPRARQNVILELGYFIGRLGRGRVWTIVRSEVELPSDMHGLVYASFDGDSWKLQIVRELRSQGFTIDANSLL